MNIKKNLSLRKTSNIAILAVLLGIIFFVGAYFLMQELFFKSSSIEDELTKAANEFNKSCPTMVDSETRLDNVDFLHPNTFQYNYTLVNLEKEAVDTLAVKEYLEPYFTDLIRENPAMKDMKEKEVIINYHYTDKSGNYLFLISILPDQYK